MIPALPVNNCFKIISMVVFGVFIVFSTACFASWAQSDATGLYTVSQVRVDVTSENAVQARDDGIEQGHEQAFMILAERILSPSEFDQLKAPSFDAIQPMVAGFQINNEQLADKRYIAVMALRFNPNKMTRYFAEKNAPIKAKQPTTLTMIDNVTSHRSAGVSDIVHGPRSVLVLPFYQNQLNSLLWEQTNPWRTSWLNVAQQNNNQGGNVLFPNVFKTSVAHYGLAVGDDGDRATINNLASISTNREALIEMGKRYNASYIIAPVYMESNLGQPPRVFIFGYDAASLTASTYDMNETITLFNRETHNQAINFVTNKIDSVIQSLPATFGQQKKRNIAQQAEPEQQSGNTVMRASFPFSDLSQWVDLSKIIKGLPMVDAMTIAALKPGMADVDITLLTNIEDLQQALEANGYVIQDRGYNQGNATYQITRTRDITNTEQY